MAGTMPETTLHRFTVDQYFQMADSGLFGPEAKVELIKGVIVRKMTHNPPHMVTLTILPGVFAAVLPAGWFLTTQTPVETPSSVPEPDGAVVRGTPREYRSRRWSAADIGIVIEISDSTLAFDQGTKRRVYAEAGMGIYWIINLVAGRVEVYSGVDGTGDYRERRYYASGESVPLVLDGATVATIPVTDLLP